MGEEPRRRVDLAVENRALRARLAEYEEVFGPSPLGRWGAELDLVSQALQHAPWGAVIASTSLAGEIIYVNKAFTAITGYNPEEIPTVAAWLERAYPDPVYRAWIVGNWQRDVSGAGREVVYRVRCRDGVERPIRLRSGLIPGDLMIVALEDVSEQVQALNALRESEERFRRLADSMPMALAVHSQGRLVWTNKACAEIAGAPDAESLIGEDVFSFVHASSLESTRARIAGLYAREQDAPWIESTFQDRQQRPFPVEVRATRIDWAGQPAGLVIFQDIADRRRAEEERRRLERRVQEIQRHESLAVLAGGVAHDFNNLLVGILGNTDLALMDLPPESPARAHMEGVELAARRAADLARQMLAYSGRGRFVVDRLDLNALIREIGHLLEATISKKAVLRLHLATPLAAVRADATQLRQVLMNLITNAAEAIGEATGVISVSTGMLDCDGAYLDQIRHDTELGAGPYVYLEVSDTGCGMDEATRLRVFEPFFSTKFTGRGLGLAAVLGIVKGHGGAIQVYSEPGRGSTFKVLFPALPEVASEAVACEPGAGPGPDGRQRTVLLVDDEPTVRTVGAAMLAHAGYDVLVAEDGHVALEIFGRRPQAIDCVLLDLSMPTMDGQETFRELRRVDPQVRVVLTSGYNEQEAVERFAGKGLAGFIQKPYRSADLLAVIRAAFSQP